MCCVALPCCCLTLLLSSFFISHYNMYIYMLYTCDVLSFYVYNLYCTLCKCLRSLYKYFFDISNHNIYFRSIRNLFLFYKDEGILLVIPIVATVYMGLLFSFVATNFFLCSFVDPGIYPRGQYTTPQTTCTCMCLTVPDYMYRWFTQIYIFAYMYMYMCRGLKSHPRQLIFLRKSDCLGCTVLLCLVVCLTLLASFFLPSHLSLKHVLVSVIYKYIVYILYISDLEKLLLSYYTCIYMHVQYNVALF